MNAVGQSTSRSVAYLMVLLVDILELQGPFRMLEQAFDKPRWEPKGKEIAVADSR